MHEVILLNCLLFISQRIQTSFNRVKRDLGLCGVYVKSK